MLLPAGAVLVGHRPAVRPRHHLHPVRAQHVELARPARGDLARRLQIPVAAQQQVPVEALHQRRPALPRIGRGEQVDHRMHVEPPVGVLHHHRHRRRRLGDQLHAAERHRIAEKPHPRQRRGVARRPRHPPGAMKGHDRRRGRGLRLRRLRAGHAEKLQDHERSLLIASRGGSRKSRSEAPDVRHQLAARVDHQLGDRPDQRVHPVGAAPARRSRPPSSPPSAPRARGRPAVPDAPLLVERRHRLGPHRLALASRCTARNETIGSTWRISVSTMSPPWFTSATSRSASCA